MTVEPTLRREGCCADVRKPCTYHEGYLDGWDAAFAALAPRTAHLAANLPPSLQTAATAPAHSQCYKACFYGACNDGQPCPAAIEGGPGP